MKDNFLHIWYGNILQPGDEDIADIREQPSWFLLTDEEQQKAMTYRRMPMQQKYIKTRALLRKVLAGYLDDEPQHIVLKTAEFGKPYLEQDNLFFNLSHTGNDFVIAVSNCSEVGVDLERYRDRSNLAGLVDKCFSAVERNYWLDLSEEDKFTMFFRFWVRKEAFVKAIGRGIALGLNRCVIDPQYQTRFLNIPEGYGQAMNWKIVDIAFNNETSCAVVMKDVEFQYTQKEIR